MPNDKKSFASRARHYVYIQTLTNAADGEGGYTPTWTTGSMIPVAIVPIKAVQRFQNRSVNVEATHLIYCRGLVDINEKTNRFLFGDRTFEILTVENVEEIDNELVITCKELR